MHGSHFLSEEYEISSSRLENPKKSCESFGFERSKKKSESSPAWKQLNWSLQRKLSTAILTIILLILGFMRSFGPSNMIKLYAGSQLIVAYIAPKLIKFKRGLTVGEKSSAHVSPPIIEIIPIPLHLIISLDGNKQIPSGNNLTEKNDPLTQIITPNLHSFNFTLINSTKVSMEYNATTIFEALAFSLCESYLKNHRKPTKITVLGSKKASACVMGKYRWALKIPREIISFQVTSNSNSNSSSLTNIYSCPPVKKDPFDCKTIGREDIRLRFGQLCPELSPFLRACNNRSSFERALAHIPSWSHKSIKN